MSQHNKPGLIDKIETMVPEAIRPFLIPGLCAVGTMTTLMAPAEMVQEMVVYAGIAMTGISAYVEYRNSRATPPSGGDDGSGE